MKNNKNKRIGVRITEDLHELLLAYAERYEINISDVIRVALERLLRGDNNEN